MTNAGNQYVENRDLSVGGRSDKSAKQQETKKETLKVLFSAVNQQFSCEHIMIIIVTFECLVTIFVHAEMKKKICMLFTAK